jgi:hypothetical protein
MFGTLFHAVDRNISIEQGPVDDNVPCYNLQAVLPDFPILERCRALSNHPSVPSSSRNLNPPTLPLHQTTR